MRNKFSYYIAAWAILFVIFNVIVFTVPFIALEGREYDASFWISYVFVTLAFVGQLVCAYFAFRSDGGKKLFLRLPLLMISGVALIVSIVAGTVCMVIPGLPGWVGVICCVLVLGFEAVAVMKASAAAEIVSERDGALAEKTLFIKSLTQKALSLVEAAGTEDAKAAGRKVYEVLRYSDPMSNPELADEEAQIELKFGEFSDAVSAGADNVPVLADELVNLVKNRNEKCKLLK